MLKTAQLRSKLLVTKDGKEYIVEARSVDDDHDDILWNIYEYSWDDGYDGDKPYFTESADWYLVVERPSVGAPHKGFLSKDLLTVALNVNGFEVAELQPC